MSKVLARSEIFAQSIDEGDLMEACYETASRTMFDSEPEGSKIREVADKFFEIARQYMGAVPKAGDHQVVVRAVRYMADVHAFSLLKDDAAWFRYTLEVLIELAYPCEPRTPEAAEFLADIEKGLIRARGKTALRGSA
jgi:hypothetical protein